MNFKMKKKKVNYVVYKYTVFPFCLILAELLSASDW